MIGGMREYIRILATGDAIISLHLSKLLFVASGRLMEKG